MKDNVLNPEKTSLIGLVEEVCTSLQSSRRTESILADVAEAVVELMRADTCSIFLYEDGALKLKTLSCVPEEETGDFMIELGEGPIGEAALRGRLVTKISKRPEALFPNSLCATPFMSTLSVPMMDEGKLVGVFSLHCREDRRCTEMEEGMCSFIASGIVGAMRNIQFHEEIFRTLGEMSILHRVGQIVSSLLDEKELLDMIAQTCSEHLNCRGSVLRLVIPGTDVLEARSAYGVRVEEIPNRLMKFGSGVAGKVAMEQKPLITNNLESEPGVVRELGIEMTSVICVPLLYKSRLLGTLGVFDRMDPGTGGIIPFDESDMGLITSIAAQVALALENARLYDEARALSEEKELRIKGLSLLLEITNIMRSTMDLEEILYIILTSVTMGQGLGFNRACLFLTDRSEKNLIGKMAVGPRTADEARKNWEAVHPLGKTLYEVVMEYGRYNMQAGFEIDRIIKETAIPIRAETGIIARTAIEHTSFNVHNYASPPGSKEGVLGELDFSSFASVPLIAKGVIVGVIVVDNLVTKETITDYMMNFLQLFANQAASAIEMARVYGNLEDSNKRLVDAQDLLVRTKTLATLGEFSAGVAHELRNPLVSIGGFARRLTKMLDNDTKEARYARVIATEVENLERILSQILEFVSGGQPFRKKVDIVLLFEQVFTLFNDQMSKSNIALVTEFDDAVRTLWVDEVQMRQLFINLIKNAIEAMGETGGKLKVSSTKIKADTEGVGFEVTDTGVGISPEDLEKVFDPFFTKKSAGTGLGLSMCSRIVEGNHGGRIFIDSKKGLGTSVLVWLPESTIVTEEEPLPARESDGADQQRDTSISQTQD